jgi:hypothetical protein
VLDFIVSEEARECGGVEALAEDCRGMRESPHPLFSARWFLLCFSAVFLGFFLIDVAGDAVGIKASLWAPLLMLLLPMVLGIWLERRLLLKSAAPAVDGHITGTAEIEGSVEMRAVPGDKENNLDGRYSAGDSSSDLTSNTNCHTASYAEALNAASPQDHIPLREREPLHHQNALAMATAQSPLHDAPTRLSVSADPQGMKREEKR